MALLLLVGALASLAFFVLGRGLGPRDHGEGGRGDVSIPAEGLDAGSGAGRQGPLNPPSRDEVPLRSETKGSEAEPGLGTSPGGPDPELFNGRGTLRGSVEIHGDLPAPEAWTLVLRPSLTLFGREHAEEREIHFPGTERNFTVEDLPLGGYDILARAPGRNGRALPVMLTRKSPSPFIVLEITPASYLEGYVVDVDGLPLEELELFLESTDGKDRRRAVSDPTGLYRFEEMRDGPYRLIVGPVANPLLPPRALRLATPGMRFPTLELPKLGRLDVFVFDEYGLYLPHAKVVGSGARGGVLDGVTNVDGYIRFKNLVPGRFRVRAEHPLAPALSSRRSSAEVTAGEAVRLELRFEL